MGACIEGQSDMSHVVKSSSDSEMLHRNQEFLKQAELPAEQRSQLKTVTASLNKEWKPAFTVVF